MPKNRSAQSTPQRNFVFTINGERDRHADKKAGEDLCYTLKQLDNVRYFVFQCELGESGNPHIQGYFQLEHPQRLRAVVRMLGGRAHVEPRRGNHEQARDYCRKEATRQAGPWEHGQPVDRAGQRTDLDSLHAALDESLLRAGVSSASCEEPADELGGAQPGGDEHPSDPERTLVRISSEYFTPFLRYERSIRSYISLHSQHRSSFTHCYVYHGVTGSGKSHAARINFPGAYWFPGSGLWFPGYDGQSTIVLDDFDASSFPYRFLLRLCDKYELQLPYKGGHSECFATTVVVTANNHPREWYPDKTRCPDAPLMRRCVLVNFPDLFVAESPAGDL